MKETKTEIVKMRTRPSEKALIQAAASREGKDVSEWGRPLLMAAAKRALGRGGIPVHAPNNVVDGGDA